jgi:hypothetical protein
MFVILFLGLVTCSQQTMAQAATDDVSPSTQRDKKNDGFDLETRLYFIVLSNREASDVKLPAELDPVIKQMKSSLAFKSQRLAVTLVNRVKNNGRLNLKWIGGPLPASGASTAATPTFNEFSIGLIDAVGDAGEPWIIRVSRFGFWSRIPVQTSVPGGIGGGIGVVNYEPIGLSSDFSMREGQPVLLGTLSVDTSGDAIVLAMSAKRAN